MFRGLRLPNSSKSIDIFIESNHISELLGIRILTEILHRLECKLFRVKCMKKKKEGMRNEKYKNDAYVAFKYAFRIHADSVNKT